MNTFLLQHAVGEIRRYCYEQICDGALIRKSFEYSAGKIIEPINEFINNIHDHEISLLPSEMDKYWFREQKICEILNSYGGVQYDSYLPGRIYTYRRLIELMQQKFAFSSLVDVGCGSGMQMIAAGNRDIIAFGIDKCSTALSFASFLQTSMGLRPMNLLLGDAIHQDTLPNIQMDVAINIGSFEHLGLEEQIRFLKSMERLARDYLVIVIPNKSSLLFNVMEQFELTQSARENTYPDEYLQSTVDFEKLAEVVGLELVEEDAFHVVPTSLLNGHDVYSSLQAEAVSLAKQQGNGVNSAFAAWSVIEDNMSIKDRSLLGWFKMVRYAKK